LLIGRALLRRLPDSLLAGRDSSGLRDGRLGRVGRLAAAVVEVAAGAGAAGAVLVRVGRASVAERTRLGPVL
jgi:hypothetical protein